MRYSGKVSIAREPTRRLALWEIIRMASHRTPLVAAVVVPQDVAVVVQLVVAVAVLSVERTVP